MKYKLPEGWEEIELSEVSNYINDKVTIDNCKLDNYISTTNMLADKAGIEPIGDLPKAKSVNSFKEGDVLVSNIRPYFKKIWFATFDGTSSTDVLTFRGKKNIYDKFLYYILSNNAFFDYSTKSATGTKMPRGDKKAIMNYQVPKLELKEQKAIADTLSSLDDKIENNNKINKNLEQQAQTIFKHWFIDFEFPDENGNPYKSSGGEMVESELGMIPKTWNVGRFEDIVEFNNGYGFKSKELSKTPLIDGYKVFKMGDIRVGGGLNPNKTKHWVSKEYLDERDLKRFLAKKGDLLMCMTDMKNNMKLLGHTALNPFDDVYVINQRVGHITARNDVGISYSYLYILTNNDIFIDNLRGRSNSGVQVNLTTTAIKESKVLIGDTNINIYFNKVVEPMIEKIFLLEEENQKLSQLRDTLLPKLMSGEIRIPLD